ncbi:MAG: DUF4166 domain-containing protein [Pseudomonadota bacterium]
MLYRTVLGDDFHALPGVLQQFHSDAPTAQYTGSAVLEQGGWAARVAARLAGYPTLSGTVPIRLSITRDGLTEVWDRHFGDHRVRSVQRPGANGTIREAIGPVTVLMKPHVSDGALHMPVVGIRGLGLPVPRFALRPSGGLETVAGHRIGFDVSATFVGLGRIIRYCGDLRPERV